MTHPNDAARKDWSNKILALLKAGNVDAAISQIKVAPSVKDLRQLQAALAGTPLKPPPSQVSVAIADQIDALQGSRLHRAP